MLRIACNDRQRGATVGIVRIKYGFVDRLNIDPEGLSLELLFSNLNEYEKQRYQRNFSDMVYLRDMPFRIYLFRL